MNNNYKYHKQLKNFLVESINEDLYDMKVYTDIYIYIYIKMILGYYKHLYSLFFVKNV